MARKNYTVEQIIVILRKVEVLCGQGMTAKEAVKQEGITENTYFRWRREYGGMSTSDVKRLKELEKENRFIIASQPTRGVDIGAIEMIHNTILSEKKNKKAILVVSAELSEVMSLSDKIAVMYEGKIVGVLKREEATTEKLGILMAGGKIDE